MKGIINWFLRSSVLSFHAITIPLESHLAELDAILKKWPTPPTVEATQAFGKLHSSAVNELGRQIREAQLGFTVWLGESSPLPSSLEAGLEAIPEEPGKEADAETEDAAGWQKLFDLLQNIPHALRLSHLVATLEELEQATSTAQSLELRGFSGDLKQINKAVQALDQRLRVNNHFETDQRHEM